MALRKPLKVNVGLTIPTHQGDLRLGDVLGEGSFGRVFRGSLNNKKVAIKAFNGSTRLAKGQASNEYANLEIVSRIVADHFLVVFTDEFVAIFCSQFYCNLRCFQGLDISIVTSNQLT